MELDQNLIYLKGEKEVEEKKGTITNKEKSKRVGIYVQKQILISWFS